MSDFSKEDRMVMLPAVIEFIDAMLHEGAQNYGYPLYVSFGLRANQKRKQRRRVILSFMLTSLDAEPHLIKQLDPGDRAEDAEYFVVQGWDAEANNPRNEGHLELDVPTGYFRLRYFPTNVPTVN